MFFSIAIPAYKSLFLKECINSILCQTFTDFELIIINDSSPFDIDSIVSDFKDIRIRYYKNEYNIGAEKLILNWNKCLSYAKGDYFILMGDDDKMCIDYLEEFNKIINKNIKHNVYHCRSFIIDENSKIIGLSDSRPEIESIYDCIWHRMNNHRTQFISDFVYKTSYLKNVGGFHFFPLAWASDDVTAYLACERYGIINTNKPLFCYRKNKYSITISGNMKLKLDALNQLHDWLFNFIKNARPNNEVDLILKNMINKNIKLYVLKKKTQVMSENIKIAKLNDFLLLFKIVRNSDITFSLIIYSLFQKFKNNKKLFLN